MTHDMTNTEVFRPRSSYLFAAVMIVGSILLTAQTILYPNGEDLIASVLWAAAISITSYWLFIHPKVVLFDEGITIRNPLTRSPLVGEISMRSMFNTLSISTLPERRSMPGRLPLLAAITRELFIPANFAV